MLLINSLIGLVFRRNWGGWRTPPHMVKVLLAYPLAFATAFAQTGNLYASVTFCVIIGTSFNNWFHSWGQGMGTDLLKPAWKCALVMGGSYGAFTTLAAAWLVYFTGDARYAFYAVNGFLSPIAYFICTKYNFRPVLFNGFLDGSPTAIGECTLGALLLGV